MTKNFPLLWLSFFLISCAGIKVTQGTPAPAQSKPGLNFGGNPVNGGLTVQKVGYYCEAKHGVLSFTAFGETEDKARAKAQSNCMSTFQNGPCEIASCKHA